MPPAHTGPAPTPHRQIDLRDPADNPYPEETQVIDTNDLEQPQPQFRHPFAPAPPVQGLAPERTPSPQNPEETATQLERGQREGELIEAMGQMKEDYEQRLNEMSLRMEMIAAQGGPVQQMQNPQLPSNVNPEDPVNMGQLAQMFANLDPIIQAQAVRATWGISQQEEQAILMRYPEIQRAPEPQRTHLIARAAQLGSKAAKPASGTPGNGDQRATPPRTEQRPTAQAVPLVESNRGMPSVRDDRPGTNVAAAMKAYEEAKLIKDKRQRHRAMKQAWEKVNELQGVTHEILSKSSFTERG